MLKPLILIFLFLTNGLLAKPLTIYVADLFNSSKFIGEVVITNYDGRGRIKFRSTKFKDTVNNAHCCCKLKNGYNFPYRPGVDNWTENMPFIGDTVLVFIDDHNRSVVFGKRVGTNYRLWSTLETGSIAVFVFQKPIVELSKERLQRLTRKDGLIACWDGCLIGIEQLDTLQKFYKIDLNKKLDKVNIQKFKDTQVLYIFYDDTLRLFKDCEWSFGPPWKLKSLTLHYSTGKSLEIRPLFNNKNYPRFQISRQFDIDQFKKMKIKEINWIK